MGLGIVVGLLADLDESDEDGAAWVRAQLEIVNELLVEAGLQAHQEPTELGLIEMRSDLDSMPYSFLHYLRRAAARRRQDPTYVASAEDEDGDGDPAQDPAVQEAGESFDFHLLVHSDAEGFYVPQRFSEVIFGTDDLPVAGGMLGSTQRLRDELVEVAPALGIELDADGELNDAEAARLNAIIGDDGPLYRELAAWLLLYEAARISIARGPMIVFT